jgi:hypothetical protein
MHNFGLDPDPWQLDILENRYDQVLLNCCRQAGKSTTVAVLGLAEALFSRTGATILLVSRSHRQARELFKIATRLYKRLQKPLKVHLNADELELSNECRIVCVPCNEETIRGYSGVTTLIIDEASRVPENIYEAVLPVIGASHGRIICLSTPQGKGGFFYKAWTEGGDDWHRVKITADQCKRLDPKKLDLYRRTLGETVYNQEYMCEFGSVDGLVYPSFDSCVVTEVPPHIFVDPETPALASTAVPQYPTRPHGDQCKRRVGGMDFGWTSPNVALWGTLDDNGVLWITGEYYKSHAMREEQARIMPRDVIWYADPNGGREIHEFLRCGFKVCKGINARAHGIGLVSARLQNRTLKVLESRCPNLLKEAELYRYVPPAEGQHQEAALHGPDHAMDALRYLISRTDEGMLAKLVRRITNPDPQPLVQPTDVAQPQPQVPRGRSLKERQALWNREGAWTRIV